MNVSRKRLFIVLGIAFVLVIAGNWRAFRGSGELPIAIAQADESAAAPEVDVAPVIVATITDSEVYSGRIEAIDDVDVRPLVPGTIVAVHFKDGALVNKGDLLFTIDQRLYLAEVERAAAQVASAESTNRYTTDDAERAERLLPSSAIAKRAYDQAQNLAREAAANLKAAKAQLQTAKVNLAYTQVVAPVSGRVSRAELTVGNVVSAGAGAPVLTKIVSVSPIYASFDVDEQTYLRFLAQGSPSNVLISIGLANEKGFSREGTLDSIDNRINTSSGTIRVRARFDNKDGKLLPGLYARVKVAGGASHSAVMVDDAVIGTDQDRKFVIVVDSTNRAQYREVVIGRLHNGLRVIEEGLQASDRVVVNGLQAARPNSVVKVNTVAMNAPATAKIGS